MKIDNLYEIGETVYYRTDAAQNPWMVTAVIARAGGYFVYEVSAPGLATNVCEFEITNKVDKMKELGLE